MAGWMKNAAPAVRRQAGVFRRQVQPPTDDVPIGRRRAPDPGIGQLIEDGGGHGRHARQLRARCPLTGCSWQSGRRFGCTGGADDHWVHHLDEPARVEVGVYPGRAAGTRGRSASRAHSIAAKAASATVWELRQYRKNRNIRGTARAVSLALGLSCPCKRTLSGQSPHLGSGDVGTAIGSPGETLVFYY